MAKNMAWAKAIQDVLTHVGTPMHYGEIAEAIVSNGLKSKVGATPGNSVVATISKSMKDDGEATPFFRVTTGVYTLKSLVDSEGQGEPDKDQELIEEATGGVKAFGAYWSRNSIRWDTPKPKLQGQQQIGAQVVDLSKQVGVYLLYHEREVVYVGRATDRPIVKRLQEHNKDRLKARWNSFSWFGLYSVSANGKVIENQPTISDSESLIRTLEAVLIEAMEPRQNRRGGDHFSDIDFIQVEDQEIERDKLKRKFDDFWDQSNR
jgi:hypothetical protein